MVILLSYKLILRKVVAIEERVKRHVEGIRHSLGTCSMAPRDDNSIVKHGVGGGGWNERPRGQFAPIAFITMTTEPTIHENQATLPTMLNHSLRNMADRTLVMTTDSAPIGVTRMASHMRQS